MIICLKGNSEEFFPFNVNVNDSLKFFSVLGGLSEGTHAFRHSQCTWALMELRNFDTRAFGHLGDLGAWVLGHSSHSGAQALGHSRHFI